MKSCEECGGVGPYHRPGCSNEDGLPESERHCSECFMLFSHAPDCSKKPKTGFATIHKSDDSDKEL